MSSPDAIDRMSNPQSGLSGNPTSFTGPGRDTTPFGYAPQFGVDDPTTQNELAREFGLQQAINAGTIGAGPQLTLNQNSRELLAGQIGYLNADQALQANSLNSNYANQLAGLGLQGEQLDVQRGALGRQGPLADLLHSIAGGRFDLQRTNYWQGADVSNRQARSNAITRGANTSIGLNNTISDIRNQLADQLKGVDYSQYEEAANYGEKKASLEDQNKILDIQGRQLGLNRDQLSNQLKTGLDRLGLSNAMSVSDLLNKINSTNIQDQVLAMQIFNQAIQNSDYYQQFYPGYNQPAGQPSPPAAAGISAGTGPGGTSSTDPRTYGGAPGGGVSFG